MASYISWIPDNTASVAVVSGRLDASNADRIKEALLAGMAGNNRALVVDFERLSFISSSGLRILLIVAQECRKAGRSFSVCGLSEEVAWIFEVSGFNRAIDIHSTRSEAVETSRPAGAEPATARRREIGLRSAVDFDIVGENILDIADFTVEKYDFEFDVELPDHLRDEASAEIKVELWRHVEELKRQRTRILQRLFSAADYKMKEGVGRFA